MNKRLILYLTEKCNRSCPKCYIQTRSGKDMTKETADKIIKYYSKHVDDFKEIVFIGGETMMALDLVEYFYNHMAKINPELVYDFMTNGTIPFQKLEKFVDVSRFAFNISFDSTTDKDNVSKIKNLEYALKNGYQASCLLVNTPDKIEENVKLIKMLMPYKPPVIKLLRQHKTSDFWTTDDVKRYEKVLPELIHLAIYYNIKFFDENKCIMLPDKIEINYKDMLYPENPYDKKAIPSSPICQDSWNYCTVVGIDGKQYLCDGAYGENKCCLGYIWDEPTNIYMKNFGYQDLLYNYCEIANKKTLPELDEINHKYREYADDIHKKILTLKYMEKK